MGKRAIVVGILAVTILFHGGKAEGGGVSPSIQDLQPGDTLRYTRDGSTPDRSSSFVVYGDNAVYVAGTTTFKARLYRPGYLPSEVYSRTVYVPGTRYYAYAGGWNLVSLPLTVNDRRSAAIYPLAVSNASTFISPLGYITRDTLSYGVGYLLKFRRQQSVPISGAARNRDTVVVRVGWNLIGGISTSVPVSSIAQVPPGLIGSHIYGYTNGYVIADSLLPGFGYWVRANVPGFLILSSAWNSNTVKPVLPISLKNTSSLSIADSTGASQSLFLSSENFDAKELGFFELPPVPPIDIFSARFGTGRILESVTEGQNREIPIELKNARLPLSIRWEMEDHFPVASIVIDGNERAIVGSGSLVISEHVSSVVLKSGAKRSLPTEFGLAHNFPNPFNPTTVIKYQTPITTFLTVKMYDLVGREVATLVNAETTAGIYEVVFDGSGLASGIYFYRMEAGTFTSVRKALLLK
jgi:hypothetical protein